MAAILKDRVKETSTTTGTGALTVAGAPAGFRTFASVCAVGDTFRYTVQGVDSAGVPTGEWECGVGTYSSANTITRTTVLDSSNAGAVVTLSAGSKQVWIGMDATMAGWMREKLTAARTYYVRTDGSNSNTGLANTAGGAFLTIQKAIDVVSATLDLGGQAVTVQVADGTYTGATAMKTLVGGGGITLQGNATTPANVVVSTTSANCFTNAIPGMTLSVKDMKLTTTTSGSCLAASSGGSITYSGVDFGACAGFHVASQSGARVSVLGNYTISGGAQGHFMVNGYGYVTCSSRTITISNTPAFSAAFMYMNTPGGAEHYSCTFAGTGATGKRYDLSLNSACFVNGGGANYFPGNAAGTTSTGAQYA